MEKKAGSFGFMAATVMLVLVAALSIAGTVMCRTRPDHTELEGYYLEKEAQLVKDTMAYLDGHGFTNGGVMLTRVVDGDGSRTYTVTVHHRRIGKMDETGQEDLARELAALAFEESGSAVTFLFGD